MVSRSANEDDATDVGWTHRAAWDDVWLAVCDDVARRSRCSRAAVGAVIVTAANRVVATGYNGPASGYPHLAEMCDQWCPRAVHGPREPTYLYDDCAAVHAEANALLFCDRRDREGGTIYVNGAICVECAKLVANAGLARVVVRCNPGEQHRRPETALDHLRTCGLRVDVVEGV